MADRFWLRVMAADGGGCWTWQGAHTKNGYGVLRGQRTPDRRLAPTLYAHIISYELAYGPVPAGKVIDHRCRNRGCCRPDHLEAVNQKVNTLRGASFAGVLSGRVKPWRLRAAEAQLDRELDRLIQVA